MVDIFDNLIGNFEGYALENLKEGNPNPELDTTNFDDFFGSEEDFTLKDQEEQEEQKPKKKKSKKKKRKRIFNKSKPVFNKRVLNEGKGAFGGF